MLAPITAALGIALSVPHTGTTTAQGLLAPPGTCAGQERVLAPADVQVAATRCMLNWARGHAGLTRLRHVGRLDRSALMRAIAIRRCGDFSHTPCGQSFIRPFVAVGYFRGQVASERTSPGVRGGSARLARRSPNGWGRRRTARSC